MEETGEQAESDDSGSRCEDLRQQGGELLRGALPHFAESLCDIRLPAPDVQGMLADAQIRHPQIEAIQRLVREQWPHIVALRFEAYEGRLHCNVHFAPFSQEGQRAHWPLADAIKEILGTRDLIAFFFLPSMEKCPFSSEVEIWPAQ